MSAFDKKIDEIMGAIVIDQAEADLNVVYRTLNAMLFTLNEIPGSGNAIKGEETEYTPNELHSFNYKWKGTPSAGSSNDWILEYTTAFMALLTQRSDIWGAYYRYPRCYITGPYALGEKKINIKGPPVDKLEHAPYFADKDRIIVFGTITASNVFPFMRVIDLSSVEAKGEAR